MPAYKNALYLHLEAAKTLLPVKRGPTVKKIALWLFLGRGQNAEVAQRFKCSMFYSREEYFSRPVLTAPLQTIDYKCTEKVVRAQVGQQKKIRHGI